MLDKWVDTISMETDDERRKEFVWKCRSDIILYIANNSNDNTIMQRIPFNSDDIIQKMVTWCAEGIANNVKLILKVINNSNSCLEQIAELLEAHYDYLHSTHPYLNKCHFESCKALYDLGKCAEEGELIYQEVF